MTVAALISILVAGAAEVPLTRDIVRKSEPWRDPNRWADVPKQSMIWSGASLVSLGSSIAGIRLAVSSAQATRACAAAECYENGAAWYTMGGAVAAIGLGVLVSGLLWPSAFESPSSPSVQARHIAWRANSAP